MCFRNIQLRGWCKQKKKLHEDETLQSPPLRHGINIIDAEKVRDLHEYELYIYREKNKNNKKKKKHTHKVVSI